MLQKLGIWSIVLLVVGAIGYFPMTWYQTWAEKDDYYREVSGYVHTQEPKVTRYGVALAQKHRVLDEYQRGEINERVRNLDRTRGEMSFGLDLANKDYDSKVLQELRMQFQLYIVRKVEKRTGMSQDNNWKKPEWKEALDQESQPFNDFFEMDRVINRLTWNYAGILWEKSFDKKYTPEEFARDRAEYEQLRPQLEELMAKNGIE